MENIDNINVDSAIKAYIRQREATKRWNIKNPEKQKSYSKANYNKMKDSDPEKYRSMLARKKANYENKKNSLKIII